MANVCNNINYQVQGLYNDGSRLYNSTLFYGVKGWLLQCRIFYDVNVHDYDVTNVY